MSSTVVEVNIPGLQGPAGPRGDGADPSAIRGGLIPPPYNVGTTYNLGEYVSQEGREYKLATLHTAGAFDAQNWQEVSTISNTLRLEALEARVALLEV